MDHNPYLKKAPAGARGTVEQRENLPWQHRAEPPGEFENRLADALEQLFARGIDALPELLHELNRITPDRAGRPWTEQSFQSEMKRLGA